MLSRPVSPTRLEALLRNLWTHHQAAIEAKQWPLVAQYENAIVRAELLQAQLEIIGGEEGCTRRAISTLLTWCRESTPGQSPVGK